MRTLLMASIILLLGNAATLYGQQIKKAKPAPPGTWQELGFTIVDFRTEKDDIFVTGANNFRKLRFRIFDAPVHIINMHVVYENGEIDKMDLRALIPAGGESRLLDLNGASRRIRKITFWYHSEKPGFRGKAKVAVWGIK